MSADPMVDRPRGGGILARTHKRTAERNDGNAWRGPVAGILLGGIAVLAFLALASYSPRHGVDWAGPIGRLLAEGLLEAAGIGAYGIVLLLAAVSSTLVAGRPRLSLARAGSWIVFSACAMALVDLAIPSPIQGHAPGGALGFALASFAEAGLSTWGAGVLLAASACAALVVATDLWALRAAAAGGKLGAAGSALAAKGAGVAFSRSRDAWALALREAFGDDPETAEEKIGERAAKVSRGAPLRIALEAEAPQDPRLPVTRASEPPAKQEEGKEGPEPAGPVVPPTIVVPRSVRQ